MIDDAHVGSGTPTRRGRAQFDSFAGTREAA
jgi:hypothetical protein